MPNPDPQQLERYKFLDFLLLFKGSFNRLELVERFSIGTATASRAIASFMKSHPDVVKYDGVQKRYFARSGFTASYEHDALVGLRYLAYGEIVAKFDVQCFSPPSPQLQLQRSLEVKAVAAITRAIVEQAYVSIDYVSTTSGSKQRTVAPHSIFEFGSTWYFRAYDSAKYEFRTYKFSRVAWAVDVGSVEAVDKTEMRDDAWNRLRVVRLIPHPKNPMPDALLLDLGVKDNETKELMVTEARLGFVLTDLRVDCSEKRTLNWHEYPLTLANREELETVESIGIAPGFNQG